MPQIQECVGRSQPFVKVQSPPIIAQRAPATTDTLYPKGASWIDESVSPPILYFHIGGGDWNSNELTLSTDGTFAAALDTTASSSLAIKTYVDATAIAGAPVATESTAGIGELATDAEAVAGTPSTGALALLVTPSNLTPVFAAPPAIGGTTPAAATVTDLTADGALDLDTTVAGHIKVTGAADFTIESTLGAVILNAEEAAADAIQIQSAAGGLDLDVALGLDMVCSQNAADAIILNATAGGVDITAAGAAGEDIDIVCTSGSVNLTAGEAIANSIVLSSTNGGIDISCPGASAGLDIDIANTGGSVNISASENVGDAITINASAGGIDITNTGTAGEDIDIASSGASVNISSTENAALALYLHANGGTSETIRLRADQGTGANSIEFISDAGGILAQTGLSGANAIYLHADGGTSETIKIHSDQGTGVASIEVASDVGGVTISSGLASADAINLSASAGGVDVDGALQVNIASSQNAADAIRINASAGGIDIDAAGAAAEDISIVNAAGSIFIQGGEDDAACVLIEADGGTSERVHLHADQGTGVDSIFLESDVGGLTLSSGLASADAINLSASAGGVDVDGALQVNIASSQNAADAIRINASAGGIDIDAAGAAAEDISIVNAAGSIFIQGGEDDAACVLIEADGGTSERVHLHADQGTGVDSIFLESDVGGVTVSSGLASADAINLSASAGGVDIDGALQVNIASSQADAGALTLAVSNASGGITHTGKCIFTPDAITSDNAGVAASVSTFLTQITTDGDSNEDNVTLANGVDGQIKMFAVVAAGNAADSVKITPANMAGGTQITFAADPTGLGCTMAFDGTNWTVVANNGGTIS